MPARAKTERFGTAALLLGALLAATGAARGGDQMTPTFLSRESRPMTLALLHPRAEFIKAKAVMTDSMIKESRALEDAAAQELKTGLEEKGYRVRVVTPEELAGKPELRALLTSLDNRFDEEWVKILRKPKQIRKRRYGVGEHAAAVSAQLGVDGIAVARIQAVGVTGGKIALTAILSLGQAYAASSARIDLGIIDGRSGVVEGYFTNREGCSLGTLTEKPAKIMGKVAKGVLVLYPAAGEVETRDGSYVAEADEEEAAEGGPAPETPEDVIEEFEAAAGADESAGEPPEDQ